MDWNPSLYLKFQAERTQPSIDLVNRIQITEPLDIIDLGCGPGNSTEILFRRWPGARVAGLDSSEKMIEKARQDYPGYEWIKADAATYKPAINYDLIFSNAALQWIPDHCKLVPRIFNWIKPGGLLAVQVPANNESPLHLALLKVSKSSNWSKYTSSCDSLIVYHPADFYYGIISSLAESIDIWETIYYHVLDSHKALIEWYRSTGMRTYLEKLPDDTSRNDFENEVLQEAQAYYPLQANKKVIYPFRRLFFIAKSKI
jgi:trans-aconitate 2-methyltransferase